MTKSGRKPLLRLFMLEVNAILMFEAVTGSMCIRIRWLEP